MVNFLTRILDCGFHSLALLDLFLSSDAIICSAIDVPPLRNFDHVAVSVSIDFRSTSKRDASKRDASFHCKACDYSCADWEGPCDYLRDVL